MPDLPSGTVTFLFSDIEGSTKLWEQHPAETGTALARHDQIIRQVIASAGGIVFKAVGDGFYAAFASPPGALEAAVEAQRVLQNEDWPALAPIRVRVVLHTGVAEIRDGDYFGTVLNRTARLLAAAHGGQALVSAATYELVRDRLPSTVGLRDLGSHRLKDLERPEQVYQITHPDLRDSFHVLRSLDSAPNNLPRQITSFIGREKAVADVTQMIAKTSLLTLTGAGGSGKTRLSLQVAGDIVEDYPDGVWLVELAALTDPGLVPQTVAAVVGVAEHAGATFTQALVDGLKTKRTLLVLDNCEHLLLACSQLAAALLRYCPHLRVLATSLEPLGIGGEMTYRVPSLSMPNPKNRYSYATVSKFEAVRLFIERSQAVNPEFAVSNDSATTVAQLCHRLDGIPLAIELAAARARSMSVEDINNRLDHRFRLLTGGDRSALPRQQTLRALVDWSYDLLNAREKVALSRLSVFSGGWTVAAAEFVCGTEPIEDWEVLDILTSLADKSLILAEEADGSTRYRMLESLRQYAAEKLDEFGETAAVRGRHLSWCISLADQAESQLLGPEQANWLAILESEHDNLRAALGLCAADTQAGAERDSLRLSAALWRFWVRGYLTEGREHLARALARAQGAGDDETMTLPLAKALNGAGGLAIYQGDYSAAGQFYERSLTLFRRIDDKRSVAGTLNNLGNVAYKRGDYQAARSLYEEGLAALRELGDRGGIGRSLNNLGNLADFLGDAAAARPLLEESLAISRDLGDKQGIATCLTNLGNVASSQGELAAAQALYSESLTLLRELGDHLLIAALLNNLGNNAHARGDLAGARALQRESLTMRQDLGDRDGIAYCLESLAQVSLSETEPRHAIALWSAAEALREQIGAPLATNDRVKIEQQSAAVRSAIGGDEFAGLWAAGRALDWEQAVEFALKTS